MLFKVIAGTVVLLMVLFTYTLCRAASMNKDWEEEDAEQARYISNLAKES